MLTMQDALARLVAYWTGQGCLTVQPMNTEVGAGTLNPATFLRVLGPEPWGLGWEVWLDGLEITQFTYFQQAGGLNLDPPSVEITYGVERILMALQGVT